MMIQLNRDQLITIQNSLIDSIQKCSEEIAYTQSCTDGYGDDVEESDPKFWENKQEQYRTVLELVSKELYR